MNQAVGGQTVMLPRGVFTVSLDFELIWGTLDKPKWRRFRRLCRIEREEMVGRLLALFREYDISATWCTVGHLFLDHCSGHSRLHANSRRDPASSEETNPVFYGRALVEQIRRCPTPQEIGCHSFTHAIFDQPECTRAVAEAELGASVRAARDIGLDLTSFAFPRNRVGHVDLLPRFGFTVFRGQDMCWYERTPHRRWFHRLGHLFDVMTAASPAAVLPEWNEDGLWEIPGSMLFTPSHGLRCVIPAGLRVARARKGLREAARTNRIFHLWFHPTDLVVRRNAMLDGLRRVFDTASELRAAGRLTVLPMGGVIDLIAGRRDSPGNSAADAMVAL
jgi:hypothetical protein